MNTSNFCNSGKAFFACQGKIGNQSKLIISQDKDCSDAFTHSTLNFDNGFIDSKQVHLFEDGKVTSFSKEALEDGNKINLFDVYEVEFNKLFVVGKSNNTDNQTNVQKNASISSMLT